MDFIQCAGLFYAAADVGKQRDQHPDDTKLVQEGGNGWNKAAIWVLIYTMGDKAAAEEYVVDQVANLRAHWRSRIRGLGNPVVATWLKRCDELNPVQTEIINTIRKDALTRPSR